MAPIVYIACCAGIGYLAYKKGFSVPLNILLAMVTSPLIALIIITLRSPKNVAPDSASYGDSYDPSVVDGEATVIHSEPADAEPAYDATPEPTPAAGKVCPYCGSPVTGAGHFCENCGGSLQDK